MKEKDQQYNIDRFVRGDMTAAEEQAFRLEMERDASLADDVQLTQDIVRSVGDWERKKRLMEQWEEACSHGQAATDTNMKVVGGAWMKKTLPLLTSLAACLAFGLFFLWNRPATTDINNPAAGITIPATRGDATAGMISRLVEEGNYEEALSIIDEVLADTLIDSSLPEDQKNYIKAKQELDKQTWEPVRKQLKEKVK